jgi:hypothetical protein
MQEGEIMDMCPYAQHLYGNRQGDIICTVNNALNVCCLQKKYGKNYEMLDDYINCGRRKKYEQNNATSSDRTEIRANGR